MPVVEETLSNRMAMVDNPVAHSPLWVRRENVIF